jgi:hypothetical protein
VKQRIAIPILLATLVLAACGDDDSGDATATTETTDTTTVTSTSVADNSTTTTTTPVTSTTVASGVIEVRLSGGAVEGGPRLETVDVGSTVTIRATSDVAEELHVHTYDLSVDLEPGQPGEVTFEATIPGRHEVEFEGSGKLALTLEVR